MKQFIYLPVLLGLFACSDESVEAPQYSEPEGAVKTEKFFASLEHENPVRFGEYKYDAKGNLVELGYFEYPDFMYSSIKKEYDLQNRVSKEVIYVWQVDAMVEGKTSVHEYEGNHLIKTSFYEKDGEFSGEHVFEYDNQGNQVKASFYQPKEGLIGFHTYEYEGKRLHRELHNAMDGYIVRAYEYQYNASGKLEKRLFLADVAHTQGWVQSGVDQEYFYDDRGKLTKMIQYDPWWGYGVLEVIQYEYF